LRAARRHALDLSYIYHNNIYCDKYLYVDEMKLSNQIYRDKMSCDMKPGLGARQRETRLPLALDDQICFTLYATSMAIGRTYKPMLDAMGITYPQYLVLNVLGAEDGLTIGAIANRLILEPSTVTPPVKRLEQAGLVIRRRGSIDERQVHVSLTGAGRDILERSACLGATLIERSGMTGEQLDALNRRVQDLLDALCGGARKA
jgi:DNA-binding MarR family transcriptional regulator